MSNQPDDIDALLDSKRPDGDFVFRALDKAEAKVLIERKIAEARIQTAKHIKEICPVTDDAAAERLHSRIDTYIDELTQPNVNEGE